MDKRFLEFWGNFFLNAAKGQKQLSDIAKWIDQGFSGFESLQAMFRNYYGLDEERPDYLKMWNKAEADFQKSLKDYLSLLGVVPKEEHLALVKKCEELKEKSAAQEETIRHLRMLLEGEGVDQAKVISGFEKMIAEQGEQFRELVKNFSEFYRTDKNQT
jgi:hypothetical protein